MCIRDSISAVTILAEIGDFSAFSKPGKLVAYFGIDPSVMQSGEFTGTQNKMSKRGSRLLRRVLFTIALANIRTKRDKTAVSYTHLALCSTMQYIYGHRCHEFDA